MDYIIKTSIQKLFCTIYKTIKRICILVFGAKFFFLSLGFLVGLSYTKLFYELPVSEDKNELPVSEDKKDYSYLSNPLYNGYVSMFENSKVSHSKIVFVGDSLTARGGVPGVFL